ncbi:hypothetical protein [Streptomyces sp. NPDC085665]|uniref:hypothetical protein n=1 Tax=Streptomyces sp. NPDC085665 TaxID=3365735 RepID=UPI0037D03561
MTLLKASHSFGTVVPEPVPRLIAIERFDPVRIASKRLIAATWDAARFHTYT